MTRRHFLRNTALLACASSFRLLAAGPIRYSPRTIDVVNRSTIIDMLGLLTLDFPKLYAWQRDPETFLQTDFETLRQSGITIFHPAVGYSGPQAYDLTLGELNKWNNIINGQPEYFLRVDDAGDFERAKQEGKIGILLGLQNSDHFRRVEDVDKFYALGQRVSLLTYDTNLLGGGSSDPRNPGLTEFGVRIVERMNRTGMAVDVAHSSDRTTLDAFAASRKPVLITHANCRALVPHPRCKTDEAIRKMAATGGVMGISLIRGFVRSSPGPVSLASVLDHVDHVANLVGVEHVGIGSDCDLSGRSRLSPAMLRAQHTRGNTDLDGLDYSKKMYEVTEGLVHRGYSDSNIELILGGNFRRALSEIWNAPPATTTVTAGS